MPNAGFDLAFEVITRERMGNVGIAGAMGDVDPAARLLPRYPPLFLEDGLSGFPCAYAKQLDSTDRFTTTRTGAYAGPPPAIIARRNCGGFFAHVQTADALVRASPVVDFQPAAGVGLPGRRRPRHRPTRRRSHRILQFRRTNIRGLENNRILGLRILEKRILGKFSRIRLMRRFFKRSSLVNQSLKSVRPGLLIWPTTDAAFRWRRARPPARGLDVAGSATVQRVARRGRRDEGHAACRRQRRRPLRPGTTRMPSQQLHCREGTSRAAAALCAGRDPVCRFRDRLRSMEATQPHRFHRSQPSEDTRPRCLKAKDRERRHGGARGLHNDLACAG